MNGYRLTDFDRGIQIDSKSLRLELSTLRHDEGQLSETTFTDWRRKAGATRNRHFVTQVQAVLILWQALYPESGKRSVARYEGKPKPLTKIPPTKYRHYCDQWLADGDIPVQGLRILSWIHGVGVTPKQLETIAQGQSDLGKSRYRGLSLRSLQRAAKKEGESLPSNRPIAQRFMRKVLKRTVLKPVRTQKESR